MKDIKVIVCAGGSGTPLINGLSRHMLPAYGVPLVRRVQTQLLQQGFTDVHLACNAENKDQYFVDGVTFLESPARTKDPRGESVVWHYQKYLAPDKPTMFLFGDAFYTDEIITKLFNDPSTELRLYGKNKHYLKQHHTRTNEYYAIILPLHEIKRYLEAITQTVSSVPPINYKLIPYLAFRKLANLSDSELTHSSPYWIECPDLTCDFDEKKDWDSKAKLFPNIFYM